MRVSFGGNFVKYQDVNSVMPISFKQKFKTKQIRNQQGNSVFFKCLRECWKWKYLFFI